MRLLKILILLVGFACIITAQTNNISKLRGTVYDANGAVISKVKVSASNQKGEKFETETNEDGVYELRLPGTSNLSRGYAVKYEIVVDCQRFGFAKFVLRNFGLAPSYKGSMTLDIALDALNAEPCGYSGADCINADLIETTNVTPTSTIISNRPFQSVPANVEKQPVQTKTHYCLTVRDELGATIPKPIFKFKPTKQSRSQIKYIFIGDSDGQIDVEVMDGTYDIEVKAETFHKVVLKKQRLPSDPRSCITITLKTKIPPHQIT